MMTPGQFLQSPNGRFRLDLHSDGNLVIKDNGNIIWVADGNQPYSRTLSRKQKGAPWLVVSNSGFLYDPARSRLWIAESTHTRDKSYWLHSHMSIQDDGIWSFTMVGQALFGGHGLVSLQVGRNQSRRFMLMAPTMLRIFIPGTLVEFAIRV
jgi:hypothetical protein